MKLLFAHQNFGQFGGAETNIHLAAEELGRRGFQNALLYSHRTGRNNAEWQRIFQENFCIPKAQKAAWTRGILQQVRPDVVYLHNLNDLESLEAILTSRIPVVRMVHDHSLYCLRTTKYNYFSRKICTRPASGYCIVPCLASVGRNPGGRLPVKWVSYSQKQRELRLTQRSEYLVVYSEYQKNELIQNGFDSEKIKICAPIRMLADENCPRARKPGKLILYAGQIVRGKGVDVLLQALAQIQGEFRCVILGDGNHRPYCERLSRRLGLQDRVEFRGFVPPSESQHLYVEASLFVMSSLWPEPFGMAGPEAMRYGLPVVAFDAGGIREWLLDGHNGFLVPWKDTGRFAARVQELLESPERACELGRRAAAWIRRYDSSRQLDILQQLFESLTQPRRGSNAAMARVEADPICL